MIMGNLIRQFYKYEVIGDELLTGIYVMGWLYLWLRCNWLKSDKNHHKDQNFHSDKNYHCYEK